MEKWNKEKIVFSWSGGKDSTLALSEILGSGLYDVQALLTTISEAYDRICIHGVRKSLLREQAKVLGLTLHEIRLPESPLNVEYEKRMDEALIHFRNQGIRRVGFGDIFLEDLKQYRDKNLAKISMEGIYPIWKRDTKELIRSFLEQGFKAVLTCVDTSRLPASFAGRDIDEDFLRDLPSDVDPCGENGEFHSFVYAGPLFNKEIRFEKGDTHISDRFFFRDLIPIGNYEEAMI